MTAPLILIRNEVVTRARASGVDHLDEAGHTEHRKHPHFLKTDPSPLCLVVARKPKPSAMHGLPKRSNMKLHVDYAMLVVLGRRGALDQMQSDDWMEENLHTLRQALLIPMLLGVNGIVCNCDWDPDPPFQVQGYTEGWDISGQLFTYRTEETQAAS